MKRKELESRLSLTLSVHGSAQLIFDSYDRALARTQGARLQSWLTSKLVDGNFAQDIGALFTARCGTEIHRAGAGSPLMSRVLPISPPVIRYADDLPPDMADAVAWFGDSALLASRAVIGKKFVPVSLVDQIELDSSYARDVRVAAPLQVKRETVDYDLDQYAERCAVHGLLTDSGPTRLFERLRGSLVIRPSLDPVWPSDWAGSVGKFIRIVGSSEEVIWSDRYMYRDIERLRKFLKCIVSKTGVKILLLGSRELNGRPVAPVEMARLSAVPGVDARWMTREQFKVLHERHLSTGVGGWVIPQVHVIVGIQAPGSAVAAATSAFGVDYRLMWRNATRP